MELSDLTVYKSPFKKKRFGRNNDGGYVICDIPNIKYDILLSGGISDDISFETDFLNNYNTSECIAVDGSIDTLPLGSLKNTTFVKKMIGNKNDKINTNLHEYINKYQSIFVKMDIEGGEFDWLPTLKKEHMDKLEQIVMEFHWPFKPEYKDIFKNINKTHALVHFHGNNHGNVRMYRGYRIPNIFECTYLHKKHFNTTPELNKDPLPCPLDMANKPTSGPEINLNYPPFVN